MTDLSDDWVTATVGESATFLTGFPFASSGFSDRGVRLVRGSNVKRAKLDWATDISKYWPTDEPELRAFHLRKDDIVIAMDGALVGRSYARVRESDLPAYLVQRVARLRGTSVAQTLLYQWIGSEQFVQHVDSVKTHTAIPHISPRDIRGFAISVPSSSRGQRRIARCLSDADNFIASVERLIAKKEAIKQGMVQQLLSGKSRLPGFKSKRQPIRLKTSGSTYGGLAGKSKSDFDSGSARFVTFLEVINNVRLRGDSLAPVRVAAGEHQNQVARGDVLFNGSSETPEEVALAAVVDFDPPPGTYLNSFCFGYRLARQDLIDPTYLAYLFRASIGRRMVSALAQGATRYNISKRKVLGLAPEFPPIEEQRAIAAAVTDADREIDSLRRRLSKAQAIKQGMMQELLTGRTRLPARGAVAA